MRKLPVGTLTLFFLLTIPSTGIGQRAQAVMDVRVNIVRGVTAIQQEITIVADDVNFKKRHVIEDPFTGKLNSIPVDSVLFLMYDTYPNKNIIVSVEPVQHFINQHGEEITFIIDAMGYSHKPDASSITYFDTFNCNSFQINNKGKAYLWVDGRIIIPSDKKLKGIFKAVEAGNIQCNL